MATPALRALRVTHPAAEIVLMGRPVIADLLVGLPTVDRFFPDPGKGLGSLVAYAKQLRETSFDWAVLLPDSVRSAVGPFLARIPVRAGYARDGLRRALITHALDPPNVDGKRVPISMIERYLRITRSLGCPDADIGLDLVVDSVARDRLEARLREEGIGEAESLLVVTPGASFGESKLWPAEYFAAACDRLSKERGLRTVLAPGPGEEPIAREITGRMEAAVNLSDPPTTLAELAALVERAELVLTNDTGPRHMAVALGRPVVSILGPTDPRHTNHLLEHQRVVREPVDCSPCGLKICPIDHRCMTQLQPDRVVRAALELVGDR
jgi:heptosyltransferase-2